MDTIKQEKEEFYEKLNKKRYLKDYSIINTFKYQKYVFAKDNTCVADKYINIPGVVTYKEEIDTKEIFKDILKFGETIYKKLDLIGIEDNDLVLFENSKTFTDNDIIKKEIINLFYKYGIPFPPSNMISLEKNLISNLYNYQKNVMTFNTLHFVNLSLSIYIIYSLKDILVNVKKKKAYLFSKKLTDLHNEISKLNIIFNEDIKYNKEIVNIFKKYLIKIIFLTNNYINKYFTIKNTIVMEFNNATTVFFR